MEKVTITVDYVSKFSKIFKHEITDEERKRYPFMVRDTDTHLMSVECWMSGRKFASDVFPVNESSEEAKLSEAMQSICDFINSFNFNLSKVY